MQRGDTSHPRACRVLRERATGKGEQRRSSDGSHSIRARVRARIQHACIRSRARLRILTPLLLRELHVPAALRDAVTAAAALAIVFAGSFPEVRLLAQARPVLLDSRRGDLRGGLRR